MDYKNNNNIITCYEKKNITGIKNSSETRHVHFPKMVMSNFLEIDFAIKVNDNNHCSLALSLSLRGHFNVQVRNIR